MDGGADVLRQLDVEVAYEAEAEDVVLGHVSGWIGWNISDEDVYEAADAISSDAATLGAAASEIMRERSTLWIDTVLLLDRIFIKPEYRGNRLTGPIVTNILHLLRLDHETTLILMFPEPQRPEGGPMPEGPEREAALDRLLKAYRTSGFEPWATSGVWWMPLP